MAESCTGKADSGGKMNYKNVKIAEGARIAKQSVILGNVTIGRDSCVLYYAVIRGDDAPVVIGEETNIQEKLYHSCEPQHAGPYRKQRYCGT